MASRRFGVYFAWNRPAEGQADLGVLDNRFPTLFEFRRALWPHAEALREKHSQGVEGFMEHVILADFEHFRRVVGGATSQEVHVYQREAGHAPTQLDDEFLSRIDTLVVVSLDHQQTRQEATMAEVEALRAFVAHEKNTLVICPHHDIGITDQLRDQVVEHVHHGDVTIPAQQRFSGFAVSVLRGLGFDITNRYGLNPARAADGSPAPLTTFPDLDRRGILQGVDTFNLHPHLPHLEIGPTSTGTVDVLARQAINLLVPPHPFAEAGNRDFNALLRCRSDKLGGELLVGDATLWSSAFGGLNSLQAFWLNLARLPL